jgi:hypothetical protein
MLITEKFVHSDSKTNPGHVIAAKSGGRYPPNTSIKILVHHAHSDEPITFTSDGKQLKSLKKYVFKLFNYC